MFLLLLILRGKLLPQGKFTGWLVRLCYMYCYFQADDVLHIFIFQLPYVLLVVLCSYHPFLFQYIAAISVTSKA
jgi:hypothetical protein